MKTASTLGSASSAKNSSVKTARWLLSVASARILSVKTARLQASAASARSVSVKTANSQLSVACAMIGSVKTANLLGGVMNAENFIVRIALTNCDCMKVPTFLSFLNSIHPVPVPVELSRTHKVSFES